jgi:hypothetical protein
MTRAAFVWTVNEQQQVVSIPDTGGSVGRSPDADVRIDEATVSRQQASIRAQGHDWLIENVNSTNPTRLNGAPVEQASPLSDGDRIEIGTASLVFHDLTAADRLSGPVCSHCSRENLAGDSDCWFCGTALINAPTTILRRLPAVVRFIGQDGETHDLLPDESLTTRPDGTIVVARAEAEIAEDAPQVRASGDAVRIVSTGEAMIKVNSTPSIPEVPLATGDVLELAGTTYLVITRAGSG